MKSKYLIFFILFSGYLLPSLLSAKDVEGKAKELTQLQKKIKQTTQKISHLDVKKNSLLGDLKKLDVQYGKSSSQLEGLDKDVKQLNTDLKKNRQQLQTEQHDIDTETKAIETQITFAHRMGRNEKIKLLLSQEDSSLSGRMLTYYDYLNKTRSKKIAVIKQKLQSLHNLETEYLSETEVLREKSEKIKKEQSALLVTKAERKALLKKISQRSSAKKDQLNQFKQDETKLKILISSLENDLEDFVYDASSSEPFAKLKGKLPWPIQGKIVKKFGSQRSTDGTWDGILLDAKEGSDIHAVAQGRVVFADWLRGYGFLTIIDHNKGYMTLYAFNQSLYKKVGDWVEQGTIIATAGQSGGQLETGLYFGIRRKGRPINPIKWCRKK
jgi:septal ring factor EnvC (AmiA/AmiB activator)